ncbi:TAFII55 protein conserved region family protein [Candida parapsilosis]|uniref:TAFII55_N domain-containing protein n=2 Tax=Candida parapsilosis TaxID=5480 RepID=G8BGK5_CANPC|nr:uncharacterized protein CPAR2_206330 [Candida parapsilosis]KAF6054861.1 TAFII55 protein conserved region family protein [Candida parapsilosis]KAF6056115.1 TAFII55 protein conserved region family protein [Candida parapsilosis]KAF6059047.1 TAFII55 protein conserved region family protein [Candida parapsilosis]KAF6067804.1 TAFII55 protein conserved region family protein [Candida parapsilosis]KAI5903583.1 Transcription initiation factor TFIID subunit 7 [Candida parapsilosis]
MALKLKLKVQSTEAPGNQSGKNEDHERKPPTLKIKTPQASSTKRALTEPIDGEKPKKLKLSLSKNKSAQSGNVSKPKFVPRVRIKPTRIPGEGYDSEAPDLEDDPLIEQGIVLRFLDDANLEFVHNAVESGDLTGLNVKWITRDKAVVNVNGTLYSARLIDLPTLVEVYKTIDKKNILKNLDVSQILLVLHTINPTQLNTEKDFEVPDGLLFKHPFYDHVKNQEVPRKRSVYRNGVLEPFKDVYRRLRPTRADHRVIQDIEERVDALIKLDNEAEESHFELVDPQSYPKYGHASHTPSAVASPYPEPTNQGSDKIARVESGNDLNNFGEDDAHDTNKVLEQGAQAEYVLDEDDFEVNLEEELNKVLDGKETSSDQQVVTVSPEMAEMLQSKGALVEGDMSEELLFGELDDDDDDEDEGEEGEEGDGVAEGNEGQEGEEGDEEEDEEDEEEDEEEEDYYDKGQGKESLSHSKLLEEEITELEKVVEKHKKNLSSTTDQMTKMKLQSNISSLRASLEQKKRDLSKSIESEQSLQNTEPSDSGLRGVRPSRSSESRGKEAGADAGDDDDNDDDDNDDDDDEEEEEEEDGAEEEDALVNHNDSGDSIDDLF